MFRTRAISDLAIARSSSRGRSIRRVANEQTTDRHRRRGEIRTRDFGSNSTELAPPDKPVSYAFRPPRHPSPTREHAFRARIARGTDASRRDPSPFDSFCTFRTLRFSFRLRTYVHARSNLIREAYLFRSRYRPRACRLSLKERKRKNRGITNSRNRDRIPNRSRYVCTTNDSQRQGVEKSAGRCSRNERRPRDTARYPAGYTLHGRGGDGYGGGGGGR